VDQGRPVVAPIRVGSPLLTTELTQALDSAGAVFDHSAHAVPSIRDLLPLYRDLLGGQVAGGGFNGWGGHLAVHFVFRGGSRLELLEPTQPDSQSVGRFLARNPRGGLHHLTFKVGDLAAALPILEQAGFEPFGTLMEEENWKETYLHPRQTAGALIQIAQSGPGIPPAFTAPIEDILDRAEEMRRRAAMPG
jgi:methylmalonyl-CoA/ethylmalonyl-CoA epimerase